MAGKGVTGKADHKVRGRKDDNGLTPRDRSFILEYVKDFNATQAYLRVNPHVDPASARVLGARMLARYEVAQECDRLEREQASRLSTTAEDLARAMAEIAHVDLRDVFTDSGDVRPLSEIPPHARRAIAGIEIERREGKDGQEYVSKKIKLWDKKGALELLGRYRKMFTDRVEVEGQNAKVEISIKAE